MEHVFVEYNPPSFSGNFSSLDHELELFFEGQAIKRITLAVSGGPDSMCLAHFIGEHKSRFKLTEINAVIVDHGLRENSHEEARLTAQACGGMPGLEPHILTLDQRPVTTRLQEKARDARYQKLIGFCHEKKSQALITAHHLDDQAETFLFRLASGSGLDGLAGIGQISQMKEGITLLRPLLRLSKKDLIEYCQQKNISYVIDPSNFSARFARGRLRAAKEALEAEGLSAKRLGATAIRFARAREALEIMAKEWAAKALIEKNQGKEIYEFSLMNQAPTEIRLRILKEAIRRLVPDSPYGPRLEKLEDLEEKVFVEKNFKSATLGHCLISVYRNKDILVIEHE